MTTIAFDAAQLAVASKPPDYRQLVIAGPGSGKTTTAAELARRVLDSTDNQRSVVFVSFSKAALAAVDDSFSELEGSYPSRIIATTLDSLAGQLIDHDYPAEGTIDFDAIIRAATTYLEQDYGGDLDDVAHLVVDEAQDLSADRRALLLAVIRALPNDSGFTVFGDPRQAIYRFLDSSTSDAWTALRSALSELGELEETELAGEYRSRTQRTRRVSAHLNAIRSAGTSRREVRVALEQALIEITPTTPEHIVRQIPKWPGTTAVLARTNAQVLEVADHLLRSGIQITVDEPGGAPRVLDRWLADLYAECGGSPLTRESFERAADRLGSLAPSWYDDLALATESLGAMTWSEIRNAVQTYTESDQPWHQPQTGRVVISTIHQSKGREFDNVAVIDPSQMFASANETDNDYEAMYVAFTRARERLYSVDWPRQFTRRARDARGTAHRRHPGTKSITAIEVGPTDIRTDRDFADRSEPPLFDDLTPGECITFERLNSAERPVYRCLVNQRSAGVTTDEFGDRLKALLRTTTWPDLGPVPIESIGTAMRSDRDSTFWTTARPRGFSSVTTRKRRDDR